MDPIIQDLILSAAGQQLQRDARKREPWHAGWERPAKASRSYRLGILGKLPLEWLRFARRARKPAMPVHEFE